MIYWGTTRAGREGSLDKDSAENVRTWDDLAIPRDWQFDLLSGEGGKGFPGYRGKRRPPPVHIKQVHSSRVRSG